MIASTAHWRASCTRLRALSRLAAWTAALSLLVIGAPANAGGIALLTDPGIAPYADTAAGLRAGGGVLVEFDVHSPNVVESIRATNPDVVVAVGQQALILVARQMGPTPVVFANVLAPQQYGLPPNVTGVPLEVSPAAQIEYVHGAAPRLRRLGVLYNPATWSAFIDQARTAARASGIELVAQPLSSVREVQQAEQQIVPTVDALLLLPDPSIWSQVTISFALLFGLQNNCAVLGFLDALTQAGALMSIAPDYRAIGVRARG
ncbi:MAG: ABC transporter substrate binding protein, partial [Deltaproteobacteria bacterium]